MRSWDGSSLTASSAPAVVILLAAQLPATDADAAAHRDAQAARLQARIKRIETAQNSQILELEQLPADPADTAAAAMRAASAPASPTFTTNASRSKPSSPPWPRPPRPPPTPPCSTNSRPWGHPARSPALKARLFAAFGLEILWNKPGQQVTVFVEITENTLQAIPGITDPGQDGYHETSTDDTAPMWDLGNTPRANREPHSLNLRPSASARWGRSGPNAATVRSDGI